MNIKINKLILRIDQNDQKIINDIRKTYHINISALIRDLLRKFYKGLTK